MIEITALTKWIATALIALWFGIEMHDVWKRHLRRKGWIE